MNITILAGDLTTFDGDAIVNAANNGGLGGGGVDGAVHKAAGPGLLAACEQLPLVPGATGVGASLKPTNRIRIPTGGAIPTPAFDLPCKWVIHTAGPIWPTSFFHTGHSQAVDSEGFALFEKTVAGDAECRQQLRNCFKMSGLLALSMGLKSIAFPAIATGVYDCPQEVCAAIAARWCREYIDWPLDVSFYIYPELPNLAVWERAFAPLLEPGVEVDLFPCICNQQGICGNCDDCT